MRKTEVSKIQKQFWILNKIYPDSGAYNLFSVFRLSEPLNSDYFKKAVKAVIGRHEPLRTSFEFIDNELFQYILPPEEIDIPFSEVNIDQVFDENNVHPDIIDEVNNSFDLTRPPLCRFTIFNFKNNISVLSVVFHHIIIDVRSEGIFSKEFSEAYNSLVKKQEIKLDLVPYQYSDYINEINQWYSSDQYLNKLEGLALDCPDPDTNIKLPGDVIKTDESNTEGSCLFFTIDQQLAEKVKLFSEKNNINPYRFFLAAYANFLNRLSGQDKIYIGLPLTNRTRLVSKSAFGCFINALPLPVDFSNGKSSRIILNNIVGSLSSLLDKQEIPFTDLVEYRRTETNSTMNPYFQTGFAFKPPMQLELENIDAKPLKIIQKDHQNEFDLLLTLYPENDCFIGYVRYSEQLFSKLTINRWIDIFKKIVIQLIKFPELPVSQIDILTEEDKDRLISFNKTEAFIPELLIHNYFEQQAKLTPFKAAVISGGKSLSYRELENESNQLANYLVNQGVESEDIIGVCLERSIEMVVSVLGVLKAGCGYLPMDPSFPDERIKYMYEDSKARVLITQSSLKEKFVKLTSTSLVLIDSDKDKIIKKSVEKPVLNINPQSLSYIIYTSGSTGKPKGVMVRHESVVNLIESMSKVPGITENDILLAVVTLSFDMSVYELFLPLAKGATVVVASSKDTTDGQALINLIDKYNITMLQATPSLFNILLGSGWKGKSDLRAFCGGESLTKNLVSQILPKVKEFWNCYGPTETTVYSTCIKIKDPKAPIIIGKPIDNTRIHILDKNHNQLPVGLTGEVCISGLGVTKKGYKNRPELTAEKFIKQEDGQIIYKTGDLGRFLIDGNVELFGRMDNQIKLRGFRIEPGEIESLLSRLPGIKEAVVKVHKFEDSDDRLVAFLNVDDSYKLTVEEITGTLSMNLPAYMIPSFYQVSVGFPRLPNGKINKEALILRTEESDIRHETEFELLTETQKKLYNIWENVLKTKNISPSGDFFYTGGNSLLAIRILNKIKEETGFTMSFKSFIAHPTVIHSANYIDSQSQTDDRAIELVHLTSTTNLPLSLNQKRLWLISKLRPDNPSYIIPFTYRFSGPLDFETFRQSIDILFRRHHIVFSVIKELNGEPYCNIVPSKVDIKFIDYSGLSENERSEKINNIFSEDIRIAFDLESGPLYRLYLIKNGINEYYFRSSFHHIIFDGWSWSVMTKDLNHIYNNLLRKNEIILEDIEFQQYDFAFWENSFAGSSHEAESIKFWKENLEGASNILNFPYDFQRKGQSSGRCKNEAIQLSPDLSEKLRYISKAEDSSLFASMLGAFGLQMHKYSGEEDINIGLPVAYRPHSKLENIFGMFVNTVVVRLRFENEITFRKIIKQTSEAALNAIAHQDLPFEKVVEIVNPDRSSNANPIFQVGFTWQNNLEVPIKLEGIISEKIRSKEGTSIFDISFYMWENGDSIEGEMEYNVDILSRDTVVRFRDNFINLLHSVVENPDLPVSDISLISEADRNKIYELNATDTPYERDLCIHQKFEQQVIKNPALTALLGNNRSISYKELNDHANRMANYLIMNGINVEDKVALCMDRSIEMMICIFGILKSGAAYLPLSPENPTERLNSIIYDANPKLILSTRGSSVNIPEGSPVVYIDDIISKPLCDIVSNPDVKMTSRNLAYVLYTSGSTGMPKGVMIEHHSVLNRLGWMQKAYPIDQNDTLLQKTPITFDVSVWELFWWSFNGAKLVVLPKGGEKDPETLIQYIYDYKVTTIHFVPSMFSTFFETILTRDLCNKLVNLNRIFLSGEALPLKVVKEFNDMRNKYSLPDLINLYGPTEATVDVSYYNCPRNNIESVYIGKPIDNTKLFVVNQKNILQPIGVPGELLIAGVNLARGYLNRPDLTNGKFIDFKISDAQIIRAYRSGDLVKLTPEGEIDYLGRLDNQIKIRGFRIELGDIEAKILEHPMVTHCAVIVSEKGKYKYLVAYVCLKPGNTLQSDKLRNYLSGKLPEYMVPPYVIFMENLPLTTSGKLNRKSLPAIDKIIERDTIATPSNEIEKILLNVWSDLLKIENISITDNFFDIGGNSLLAINLANLISTELNKPFKALMVFEFPSIKAQSEYFAGTSSDLSSLKNTELELKMKNKKSVNFKKNR